MQSVYTVVAERSIDDLIGKVNTFAADGWIPVGGIATECDPHGFICYQAMVKGIAATMHVDVVNVIAKSVTQAG